MPAGNIISAYTVREPAWWDTDGSHDHDRYPDSIAEARQWAGHEFEWIERPNYAIEPVADPETFAFEAGDRVLTGPDGTTEAVVRAVKGERRIVRSDSGLHVITRANSFELISVAETWQILEAIVNEPNVKFETGGVLDDSKRIWALAKLDEPWQAPGDASLTYPYVVVLNAVDSSESAKAVNTTCRVVCANTWSIADAEGARSGRQFTFRHTANVHERIEEARDALKGVRADNAAWQELTAELAQLHVTPAQTELFVTEFHPMPPDALISDRVASNVEQARAAVRGFLASETVEGAGIGGTAYGLVQAAGEWQDHVRGYRNRDTLLGRQLLKPQAVKARAVELAREIATSS